MHARRMARPACASLQGQIRNPSDLGEQHSLGQAPHHIVTSAARTAPLRAASLPGARCATCWHPHQDTHSQRPGKSPRGSTPAPGGGTTRAHAGVLAASTRRSRSRPARRSCGAPAAARAAPASARPPDGPAAVASRARLPWAWQCPGRAVAFPAGPGPDRLLALLGMRAVHAEVQGARDRAGTPGRARRQPPPTSIYSCSPAPRQ